MPTAINKETGEIRVLDPSGQWVEPKRARNPQTGEEVYLDGDQWKPVPTQAPDTSLGARAERFGLGIVRGLRDPIDAGAQLLTRGLEAIAPEGSGLEAFARSERERVEGINREAEREYQQEWRDNVQGFDAGRLVGNVAGTAPVAALAPATVAGGVAAGAAGGALQPVYETEGAEGDSSFWLEKAKQAVIGGAAGGAGAAITRAVSRAVRPQTRPEVTELMEAGVRPTPGQTLGGAAQRLEEGATSIPILGDVIKNAQVRSMEGFNRAAINRALAPIGQTLDDATAVGREAIEEAGKKISSAYDDLLPKLTVRADSSFVDDLASLRTLAQNLPPERATQFDKILRDTVLSKFNPQTGQMTGETMKQVESELGRLARNYTRSADADQRLLGDALREVQSTLRGLVERSNPSQAGQLANINRAYSMLLRLENAASRAGSKEGVFSPAALTAATRQLDSSLRKRAFARGDALLQDFAEAGQSVLGPRVPDSGTPFRVFASAGIPLAAYYANPVAGLATGAAMLPYTRVGQNALATMLTSRPAAAEPIANALRSLAPYLSAGAGAEAAR